MERIHVSRESYSHVDPRERVGIAASPACGARAYAALRGTGEGLIHYGALHPNFHCPDCIRAIRNHVYTGAK